MGADGVGGALTPAEVRHRAVAVAVQAVWDGPGGVISDNDLMVAIVAYEAALWQPIETAPRDGTIVMGWTGTRLFIGQWFDGAEGFAGVSGALIDGARGRWIGCTHWRPLPAGPGDGA